ncbi:MAG TPA: aminoacyl-tRNA hydrolase [Candidatus Limiplasma sp.]|nr:aminoacyl-tRNA hydrolase [Candidatus Limiplasma sp.]
MHLIVGLGNPGDKYDHTRHNAGFDVLTLLADKLGIKTAKRKGSSLLMEGQIGGEKVILCKPQTYMNLSGAAVQELMAFYKLSPDQLLVIYDDIDIPQGYLRIRRGGSAGTHNGMRSILACIDTQDFARLRIGIGQNPGPYELADWVLSRYNTAEERQIAFDAFHLAADAAIEWVRHGVESAMRKYNTKKPKPEPPDKTGDDA